MKINNLDLRGNRDSEQVKQVLKFLNLHRQRNLRYVPPVRINNKYKNVVSNWFCVQSGSTMVNMLNYQRKDPKLKKSKIIENKTLFMNIEISSGEYIRAKIYDNILVH